MSLTSVELWQKVVAANLASPQQCRSWAADVARDLPAAESVDGLRVLQCLIDQRKLTKYQARALAGQSDQPLQRGQWLIRTPLRDPVWNGWFEVAPVPTASTANAAGQTADRAAGPTTAEPMWGRWLNLAQLQSLQSAAPSMRRALQLNAIQHPQVQFAGVPIRNEAAVDETDLLVLVQPVRGQTFSDVAKPVQPLAAARLMLDVARGLAELHSRQIVHGRVLPDRLMLVETSGRAVLLVDPLCAATAILDRSAVGLLGSHLPNLHPEQFLAPEFLAPGQQPSAASDIYALGCTWFWMLTGEAPAHGNTAQQILASQVAAAPELPTAINCPPAIRRCLAHCLAKNLDARFRSAAELAHALEQALAIATAEPIVSEANRKVVPTTQVASPTQAPLAARVASPTQPASSVPNSSAKPTRAKGDQTAQQIAQSPAATTATDRLASAATTAKATTTAATDAASAKSPAGQAEPSRAAKSQPAKTPTTPLVASLVNEQPDDARPRTTAAAVAVDPRPTAGTDASPSRKQNAAPESATPASAAVAESPTLAARPGDATYVRRRRRQGNPRLLIMVAGVCGFALVLIGVLKFSGALDSKPVAKDDKPIAPYRPTATTSTTAPDPLLDVYQVVERAEHLWAPPALPTPIPLDLLPPGGQLFVSFRPQRLLEQAEARKLLALIEPNLQSSLQWLSELAGQPLENIQHATLAAYGTTRGDGVPEYCVRITLTTPKPLSGLKQDWKIADTNTVAGESLLANAAGTAYYIAQQPLVDAQSVESFSCGPAGLMREVAELKGAAGPLVSAMESLWQQSDSQADVCIQASPRFLYADGRGIVAAFPGRLQQLLTQTVERDARGLLLKSYVQPQWYWEAQMIGESDRDAPAVMNNLQERLRSAPAEIENWFVESPPHPYWRAVALRYPQMLRQLNEYSRFGVENGVAIMNAYLPTEGAGNLIAASWIALQPGATTAEASGSSVSTPTATPPLTIDEYLARPVRLSFDQEPIEVALALIGDEANAGLPAGTPALQFLLDGDAFEKAGITRNQQIRDFRADNTPVRVLLTELAKRGNPVTTVTDTRQDDQKLIWVVAPAPAGSAGDAATIISLTTREAAAAAGIPLPKEFAP